MKLIAAPVIEVRRRLKRLEALPWWWWCAFALVVFLCVAAILNLPNVQAWATIALLIVTMRYVMLIHKSILNTIILRQEDRELDSNRRRLDEVQHWINQVLRLKSECASHVYFGDGELARRAAEARIIISNKEYIKMEAGRVDSEFKPPVNLDGHIGRLSYILEHEVPKGLSNESIQQELESKCIEVLKTISDIKAELKL